MTSPEAPSSQQVRGQEGEEDGEEQPDEGDLPRPRRRFTWVTMFRLMLSPMAFLAPCLSCAAATTLSHSFGTVGGVLGGLGGFVLGVGCILFWYFVIVGHHREEKFVEETIAEAVRPARSLGGAKARSIEAIPLEMTAALAVDIDTDLGSAVARIDVHGDAVEALAAAETLRANNGRDARAIACLARALLRTGRPKEGVRLAAEALHVAVLTDQMGVVTRLVQSFWDHRDDLALEPSVARTIADHLDVDGQSNRAAFFRSGRTSLL